jgi:hypothetical protein
MPIPYENTGPIDNAVAPDLKKLRDKSIIVTGGTKFHRPYKHRTDDKKGVVASALPI